MVDQESRKRKPKKPRNRIRIDFRSKTFWMEVLFFVALTILGFSFVSSRLGFASDALPVNFALQDHTPEPEPTATPVLYEVRSLRVRPVPQLSPIFTPSVQYWKDDIIEWAGDFGLDPNLVATVMQIESCGNPDVQSWAGATGLYQVMPFHFETGEDPTDPDTNALRGLTYLSEGMAASGGHAGLALAGYNAGHAIIFRNYAEWPHETQRYYRWGSGIYREASSGWDSSPTLAAWLLAGGQSLCDMAESALGISASR